MKNEKGRLNCNTGVGGVRRGSFVFTGSFQETSVTMATKAVGFIYRNLLRII